MGAYSDSGAFVCGGWQAWQLRTRQQAPVRRGCPDRLAACVQAYNFEATCFRLGTGMFLLCLSGGQKHDPFMGFSESLSSRPIHRFPAGISVQWCTSCQLTLRTEAEYLAHTQIFPSHYIKPVKRLPCPCCGNDVPLDGGRYSEHWLGYTESSLRICRGSGTQA